MDERRADRATDTNANIRAARLARRARLSVLLGICAILPLSLAFLAFGDPQLYEAIVRVAGTGEDAVLLLLLGFALALALLGYLKGMSAADRANTQNRPVALAGMILGGLVHAAAAGFFFWALPEMAAAGSLLVFGGALIWLAFDVYFRGPRIRTSPGNSAAGPEDADLDHRLLRRAQWSVILGIAAALFSGLLLMEYLLFELLEYDLPRILHLDWDVVAVAALLGSLAAGFGAAILGSGASQRRNAPGNSLAWTGIVLGMIAVGTVLVVMMDYYWS